MRRHATELDKLLERVRELLGSGDDTQLGDANMAVNQALTVRPDSIEGWLLKAQVESAMGDDLAALAAAEMAVARGPERSECLYWRGAVLGDLGRYAEALRAIEDALGQLSDAEQWLLEDLYYEKVTVLDALGMADAAVATCEEGLRACPGSALLRAALVPAERARVRGSLRVIRGGA
jgi:tetratricopeptide (TPR) repeat protein